MKKRRYERAGKCNRCGKIEDVDDPDLSLWIQKLGKKTDYQINEQSIGLYGECNSCLEEEWIRNN